MNESETMQKIVLSSNHEHGWATEYPRAYQEYFLMDPLLIRLVENRQWDALREEVTRVWSDIRLGYANPDWPICLDAIPDLKILEVPRYAKFILNEVPYENIVMLNDHNVITAAY